VVVEKPAREMKVNGAKLAQHRPTMIGSRKLIIQYHNNFSM
jgi:hypothetical protein